MSVSSPYQSRFFQRLTQQSHRWSQQWQQTLQRGKVAAVWGVQALLFPLYVLWQGAQRGGKRLRQAVPHPQQLSASGRHEQAGENRAARLETTVPVQAALAAVSVSSDRLRPQPLVLLRSLLGQLQRLSAWRPAGLLTPREPEPVPLMPEAKDEPTAGSLSLNDSPQRPALLTWVQPQQVLVQVDRTMAALEQWSGKIRHLWPGETGPQPLPSPAGVGQDAFRIQTLIYAAIAYFFGRRDHSLLASASASLPSSGGFPTSASHALHLSDSGAAVCSTPGALWVTWHDLFGRAAHPVAAAPEPPSPSAAPQSRAWSRPLPKSGFPAIPPIPGVSLVGDGIHLEIETEAVFMGYVKHPLRQMLEWLDRIVAWIEKRLTTIWSNARSFVAGFLGLPDRS